MPSEIAHVYYAERFWACFCPDARYDQFLMGALLPDIRYLGDIHRDQTHLLVPHLTSTKEILTVLESPSKVPVLSSLVSSDFRLGFVAHSIIDRLWDDTVIPRAHQLKISLPDTILKLHCDILKYHQVSNWKEVLAIIDKWETFVLLEGVLADRVRFWYSLLTQFYVQPVTAQTVYDFWSQLRIQPDVVELGMCPVDFGERPEYRDLLDRPIW